MRRTIFAVYLALFVSINAFPSNSAAQVSVRASNSDGVTKLETHRFEFSYDNRMTLAQKKDDPTMGKHFTLRYFSGVDSNKIPDAITIEVSDLLALDARTCRQGGSSLDDCMRGALTGFADSIARQLQSSDGLLGATEIMPVKLKNAGIQKAYAKEIQVNLFDLNDPKLAQTIETFILTDGQSFFLGRVAFFPAHKAKARYLLGKILVSLKAK